jgi:hypothetical protein
MKAADWIDLIQKFPQQHHDGFGIIMENGLDITVQAFLQMTGDHILVRGRTVGSTDAGRYFYLPYDRINCVVFNRPLAEDVVLSWYEGGETEAPLAPVEGETEEAPAEEAAPAAAAAPAPAPKLPARTPVKPAPPALRPAAGAPAARPAAGPAATGLQTSALANTGNNPIKTALLERLRARRQGEAPPEKK